MGFFIVEPEVAGELGPRTVFDRAGHTLAVTRLEYQFFGWLGDPIVESTPCFIVTEELSAAITAAGLTGATFDEVEVSVSPEGEEFIEGPLPPWKWLRFTGEASHDDLGLNDGLRLVVSERALGVLREHGLSNAEVAEASG
ncbi:hypothetical protein NLX83_37895 [Allokutzneria sp. A3M-2-11 16]|uniref:hypothetical protein n=1 Tax=Allokutzneria sp. A3M-2-11 16 TaxID=2962043 RepID=UPI0020B88B72|nr:hypothetical protein [Allokutzneria sp. A3M-2-11 16]MCP3805056.1 hypothetical protein [Allokutzneria sp. A3M-2-11 16]